MDHAKIVYGFPHVEKCCEETCGAEGEYQCSKCNHLVCGQDAVSSLFDYEMRICGHCLGNFVESEGKFMPNVENL